MTKKPSNKTITFKDIKKQNNKTEKWTTYVLEEDLENNKNKIIKYREHFGENKITELLVEAHQSLITNDEKGLGFFNNDEEFLSYIHFLIAVRFTNLDKDVPKDFEQQVPYMNELINTGLFKRIFDEVLLAEEVDKVLERLVEFKTLIEKIGKVSENGQSLLNDLENKEVLKLFDKDKK